MAVSAQVEMTDPVLPIPAGQVAAGTAAVDWVAGGRLYNSVGNLGDTFSLGSIRGGQLYFHGDIFSWIDNPSLTDFSPRRLFYTLEPGYNWVQDGNELRVFIKHQSFHSVDTPDVPSKVSYELVGFSYRRLSNPRITLRVGGYVDKTTVDYGWDLLGSANFDLPKCLGHRSYAEAWVHHVTETGNPSGRNGFTDFAAECGLTIHDGFSIFARYEFLHDVDVFNGTSDHHYLVGPKYVW
jgi:hypothetical protein